MNKKLIVTSFAVLFLLFIFIFLNTQKYSITDITADNYENLLKESSDISVYRAGVYKIFGEEDQNILTIKGAISAANFELKNEKTTDSGLFETITHTDNAIEYTVKWKTRNYKLLDPIHLSIFLRPAETNEAVEQYLKQGINRLILEEGFILKRSERIEGRDIIIAELNDGFVIGEMIRKYDEGFSFISFSSFKKRKYFQFL